MNCSRCRHEIPPNARFCPQCGRKIAVTGEKGVCSRCGADLQEQDRFCPICGADRRNGPKTLRVVLTVLAALVLLCVGCGLGWMLHQARPVQTEPAADAGTPTENVLTVAVNLPYWPYVYRNEAGKLTGIDVELIRAAARELGQEVQFREMDFDAMEEAVANGEVDIAVSALPKTEARQQSGHCTQPYAAFAGVLLNAAGNTIPETGLDGTQRVGLLAECSATYLYEWISQDTDCSYTYYTTIAELCSGFLCGEITCAAVDSYLADYVILHGQDTVEVYGLYYEEEYVMDVNPANPALREALNREIAAMQADGSLDEIVRQQYETKVGTFS